MSVQYSSRAEGPARPSFGIARPAFGLSSRTGQRVELVFSLKSGGSLGAFHDLGEEFSEEIFGRFVQELQEQVSSGKGTATFVDSWSSTGIRAWMDLSQVIGFTVRPAR